MLISFSSVGFGAVYVIEERGDVFKNTGATNRSKNGNAGVLDTVVLAMDGSNYLYAVTDNGLIKRSIDDGVTWSTNWGQATCSGISDGVWFNSNLYIGTNNGTIAYSSTGGANWTYTPGTQSGITAITATSLGDNYWWVLQNTGNVAYSTHLTNWIWQTGIQNSGATGIAVISGSTPHRLWVSFVTGELAYSDNPTATSPTWSYVSPTPVSSGIIKMVLNNGGRIIFLDKSGEVWYYSSSSLTSKQGWDWSIR